MTDTFLIRPIAPTDNAAMAAIIRAVMPEFGADGPGFAIHDAEVDTMYESYAQPRSSYFVVERDGVVIGGGGVAPLQNASRTCASCARCTSCPPRAASVRARR